MEIIVYRYGHRLQRDKRITTHTALASRALGADGIIIDKKDTSIEKTISKVVERFGGSFTVKSGIDWKSFIPTFNGTIVHLTMYGNRLDAVIDDIRKSQKILILIGAEKVPPEFYEIADFNVGIGNQPHSEVAALAIFLDELTNKTWRNKKFDGVLKITPNCDKKTVIIDYLKILKKEKCSAEVINHSIKVKNLSLAIAEKIKNNDYPVNLEIIEGGALLHDIGRSKTHDINHIIEGIKIARKYNVPPRIINIIKSHIGAGISKEEASLLGLPEDDYSQTTIEEKIVAHADNLTGKRYRSLDETIQEFRKLKNKDAIEKLKDLHAFLSKLSGENIDNIIKSIQP